MAEPEITLRNFVLNVPVEKQGNFELVGLAHENSNSAPEGPFTEVCMSLVHDFYPLYTETFVRHDPKLSI